MNAFESPTNCRGIFQLTSIPPTLSAPRKKGLSATPFGVPGICRLCFTFYVAIASLHTTLAADPTINQLDPVGRLAFQTITGASFYSVEWSTNLLSPAWSTNAPGLNLIPPSLDGTIIVTVGVQSASCCFRLVALTTNAPIPVIASTFSSSNDNWLIVSYPFHSHVSAPATMPTPYDVSFGNPAGSLRIGDVYGETGAAAPAEFLGDKGGYYGGTLSYDIQIRFSDNTTYPAVVLNAGTMSLYFDDPSPPLNSWQHKTIPLTESGWKVSGSAAVASEAIFRSVMTNLVGVYIYTEWHTGDDDTSLDNVVMAP